VPASPGAIPGVIPGVIPGAIPSPANPYLDLGPVHLRFYGLLLAIGIFVATWIAARRWAARGHDANEMWDAALFIALGGIVGARLYHVVSDYQLFEGDWLRAFQIWKGGLSIWGAVIGGVLTTFLVCRWKRLDALAMLDAIAPGLAVAQAIGRIGNWFNQELFGKPTDLPWGLEIDPVHRPPGFERDATFHPTFLYESLACLAIAGLLVWAERRFHFRRGQTMAAYVVLYTTVRFFIETFLRIDVANEILGLRVNTWTSALGFVLGVVWFVWLGRRPAPVPADAPDASTPTA
jgi:prolipoprotein diacylglyceryl transferase